MIFHSHANKTHFHKKGCALRKWPIIISVLRRLAFWYIHIKGDTVWLLIDPFCIFISARFYSFLLLLSSYPDQIIHTPPPPTFLKVKCSNPNDITQSLIILLRAWVSSNRLSPDIQAPLRDPSKNYSPFCYWKLCKDCLDTAVLILRKGRQKVR